MNPTFPMRTGFDVTSALNDAQEQTLHRLMLVFTKQATTYAGEYTIASGRTTMTWKDMELGMKVAAMPTPTYNFWAQNNIREELNDIEAMLNESSDTEEVEDDVEEVEWTHAPSEYSPIVRRMNEVEGLWEQWEPTDTIGRAIKNALSVNR